MKRGGPHARRKASTRELSSRPLVGVPLEDDDPVQLFKDRLRNRGNSELWFDVGSARRLALVATGVATKSTADAKLRAYAECVFRLLP